MLAHLLDSQKTTYTIFTRKMTSYRRQPNDSCRYRSRTKRDMFINPTERGDTTAYTIDTQQKKKKLLA